MVYVKWEYKTQTAFQMWTCMCVMKSRTNTGLFVILTLHFYITFMT